MQSDTSRYINSVSDLYGDDEIELLLQDITELEPQSCKVEDIQDFEIAGSRTGALSADCAAGGCECETPLGTINSWDSHSHYRRRPASPDISLYSGVIVYCDHKHLKTPTGVVKVLLVITTVACLACLCTSGTVKVGLFMLPLAGRLRLMMFVTLLSIFVTCVLLFLDISQMVYLFPFNWGKVNTYLYLCLSVSFLIVSSLIFHAIFLSGALTWVPKWTHQQLLITGCLGYVCCLESLIIALIQKWTKGPYEPVAEDPSLTLQERRPSTSQESDNHRQVNQTTHNYKPIVRYPAAVASTSRQQHDSSSYLDDVQPCSSKSVDQYRNV
ncbi:uncharacterized protein [Onthophagus taurus]|uniref:uncharacterized protein isoform X2 n=1 Tax=Onthophagus taurus TaxID=166361 RepID=UPI000C1FDC1B|nr:uncharacterized protein LOC111418822 isoform X2 [Onthophagus taurus]